MKVKRLLQRQREMLNESLAKGGHAGDEDPFAGEIDFLRHTPSAANLSMVSNTFNGGDGFWTRVKGVITNKSFVSLCITLSGLFFVVTGIQYWASDYLKEEFGRNDTRPDGVSAETVAIYFAITSFTAPISGAVAGGITTS